MAARFLLSALAHSFCVHLFSFFSVDLADRNQHCVAEFRVKELYRKRLKKIVKEIEEKSTDRSLVQLVKKQLKDCQKELAAMPEIPVPEGLANRLK